MTTEGNDLKYRQQIKITWNYNMWEGQINFQDQVLYQKIIIINVMVMKGSIKICIEGHIRKVMISS